MPYGDGFQFVAIGATNSPASDRLTVVLTHGWVPGAPNPSILSMAFDLWPSNMAAELRTRIGFLLARIGE